MNINMIPFLIYAFKLVIRSGYPSPDNRWGGALRLPALWILTIVWLLLPRPSSLTYGPNVLTDTLQSDRYAPVPDHGVTRARRSREQA